ncbi:hypothetical protein FKP32DRAFT_1204471 [Trametes sanguinea]|nr:hypothetical protein FKP32DRAFT_1204471 [Trametes sanguinea]
MSPPFSRDASSIHSPPATDSMDVPDVPTLPLPLSSMHDVQDITPPIHPVATVEDLPCLSRWRCATKAARPCMPRPASLDPPLLGLYILFGEAENCPKFSAKVNKSFERGRAHRRTRIGARRRALVTIVSVLTSAVMRLSSRRASSRRIDYHQVWISAHEAAHSVDSAPDHGFR